MNGQMTTINFDHFTTQTVYIDYSFEEVMYRWDHNQKVAYAKFYGKAESRIPIPHSNKLFCDACLSGEEITEEQYKKGKIPMLYKLGAPDKK
jgi:hypothetical protein